MGRYDTPSPEVVSEIQAEADKRPCPKCGAPCHYFSDCPGYGSDRVFVCGDFYSADIPSTGKSIFASACGNATLWACQNEDCDWEYRTPNRRGSASGPAPTEWNAYDAMNYRDDGTVR